jgi:hypothetical protein
MTTSLQANKFLCDIPEYWQAENKPTTLEELITLVPRKAGIWMIKQINNHTGEVELLQVCENTLTDNGALSLWKNCINATSAGIAVANIIAIDQSLGYTTTTANIAAGGTVTSITVGSLTGPTIANGSTILVGAGTGNTLTLTLTQAITGAGTYTVSSATGPASQINSGANVRVIPATTDASSLSAPVSYTAALPAGQFTISGSGSGNRSMQVTNSGNYLFSTTSNSNPSTATAANYTAAWIVNANPVASTGNTFVHVAFDAPVSVSSSSSGQITIIEKI